MVAHQSEAGKLPVFAFQGRYIAMRLGLILFAFLLVVGKSCCTRCPAEESSANGTASKLQCEKWGYAEIVLPGPTDGNPFLEVTLSATFRHEGREQRVAGFYDGDGVYRIRFMPDAIGEWTYETESNRDKLDGRTGAIEVAPPSKDNHGPVQVHNTFHFAYADGSPYRQLGTTCYAWIHQGQQLEEQTLKTLAESPFNKLRMCVFPKRYTWNENEPQYYPFEGTAPDKWNFDRFNPAFFRHLEQRVFDLQQLGIEADVILFHPYDEGHWGFDRMPDEVDDRYLRYVIARLAAFRNVWWSLANEFDFMTEKQPEDWDRLFQVVAQNDPYGRLRSIHNGRILYNHNQPWVTHASIQNGSAAEDAGRAVLYRDAYLKPVVFDEIKYEGDIPKRWGNLSPEEMIHRFWECIIAGTYPGHGECYLADDDVLWWSKGGQLKGESHKRIAFLKDILATAPNDGIEPIDKWQYTNVAGKPGEYYLIYFGRDLLDSWRFFLPRHELADGMRFKIEVLDTWNMKVQPVDWQAVVRQESDYVFVDKDNREVELPNRPGIALRITRIHED